jgi:hypothetical protein
MHKQGLSRREFVFGSAAGVGFVSVRGLVQAGPTVQQIVDRIRANIGVPWRATTVDGLKAGDSSMAVTGIATTAMATVDVLRRAATSRQNLVITQEPAFYAANDEAGTRASDPVYLAKQKLIADSKLAVYRLADHWSARQANESATGVAATLGWTDRIAGLDHVYRVPETTVASLAARLRTTFAIRGGMRIVGRGDMRVRTVFISPETTSLAATIRNLPHADVILAGEPREWEAVPYTLDTAAAGNPKAMIAIGRIVSERSGMERCAAWLKELVAEVPVSALGAADPYWSPLT